MHSKVKNVVSRASQAGKDGFQATGVWCGTYPLVATIITLSLLFLAKELVRGI